MAIELFGVPIGIYAGIAWICSYLCFGHTGIYRAQRVGLSKYAVLKHHEGQSLHSLGIEPDVKPNHQRSDV